MEIDIGLSGDDEEDRDDIYLEEDGSSDLGSGENTEDGYDFELGVDEEDGEDIWINENEDDGGSEIVWWEDEEFGEDIRIRKDENE